jgi:DNA integrity scanning protein DisA with diadenylate cyclase activity
MTEFIRLSTEGTQAKALISGEIIMVLPEEKELLRDICTEKRGINLETLEEVILLAVEIAREGREGRKVGTMFVISDSEETLKHSKSLILDPLLYHPEEDKSLKDVNMRETVKELSQLDGAFIVSDEAVVISATRYIDASSEGINLPLGLGSRHMAAASITNHTNSIAVVVSESAVVRIFDNGEIISEIIPELWLFRRHGLHLEGPLSMRSSDEITVASKKE